METPARYRRATSPLGEKVRARLWRSLSGAGSSSGSDRPAEDSSPELSDLVDSFYTEDGGSDGDAGGAMSPETSTRELLEGLVDACRRDKAARIILSEAEAAWRSVVADGEEARWAKRRLMWRLREKGVDAGLCKPRGGKMAVAFPALTHYVDVVVAGSGARYVVEPGLAAEFSIARPTPQYQALLNTLPAVFVGRLDALKEVVGVMCAAAAESLKSRGMHVPPWRRREHMQGKWSDPYKRTTNRGPKAGGELLSGCEHGGGRGPHRRRGGSEFRLD